MEFVKFIFSDVAHFLGACLILSGIGTFIDNIVKRILRYRTIQKVGYPPPHCNVEGLSVKKGKEITSENDVFDNEVN